MKNELILYRTDVVSDDIWEEICDSLGIRDYQGVIEIRLDFAVNHITRK